ncbi:restriction endonuclease [Streptomyces sp. NPDC057620]|uniref:restriction endonuclease n=1 Tax=Streptomyces sp. NPDC057620 TaxID=3346185 RepID=UPI0036A10658
MPAVKKKTRRTSGWWLVALAALLAFVYRWITEHPMLALFVFAVLALAAVFAAFARVRVRYTRARWRTVIADDPHRMNPTEFEHWLADLCVRDGCRQVQVVGGANDHGADVLYVDPHGEPGMIQAKRYAPGNSVGNEHVQIVNGTYRDYHGASHAAIVTTSHFTKAATAFAGRVGIALLDSHRLDAWARGQLSAAPWN